MILKDRLLTLDGTIQSLAELLDTEQDTPAYAIDLQCDSGNANAVYVGGFEVASTTGIRLPVPDTTVPAPPYRIGDFGTRQLSLHDVYVIGTNTQKLHVLIFT